MYANSVVFAIVAKLAVCLKHIHKSQYAIVVKHSMYLERNFIPSDVNTSLITISS